MRRSQPGDRDGGGTAEATFNAPPGWSVPRDFYPGPDWSPDPAWPPAPADWAFWGPQDTGGGGVVASEPPSPATKRRRWRLPIVIAVALAITAAVVLGIVLTLPDSRLRIDARPEEWPIAGGGVAPDWPSPAAGKIDFSTWSRFGGIDAQFADDGTTVRLDTHDTTDTWRTKWSGLVEPGPPRCELRLAGRVRDSSHAVGVPGGFAMALAAVGPGDPGSADLTGTGIQFDFGASGFRTATYPDDSGPAVVAAALDGEWHDVTIAIGPRGHALTVDGRTVVDSDLPGRCGNAVLRVWAGSAEFADFTFE